ncbi:hypothetical protein E2562_020269 [Oryza meyeriana var. granulata]|uniref:HTH myb-type domain-containing protein n=1 Tax=Oryza meyeriana var. granulata TaxID=110450 RepID=A0A6G1DKI5_9ORYZ|nr:hypothetical protein E2562_020269 [Oryza meyeriana var. granulata]
MQLMSVDGLTRENVASHLQKYRLYLKQGGGGIGGSHSSGSGTDAATGHLFAAGPVPFLPPGRALAGGDPYPPVLQLCLPTPSEARGAMAVAGPDVAEEEAGSPLGPSRCHHAKVAAVYRLPSGSGGRGRSTPRRRRGRPSPPVRSTSQLSPPPSSLLLPAGKPLCYSRMRSKNQGGG